MDLIDGLREILKQTLPWNKARLDCFCMMLVALLQFKRVNLTQLLFGLPIGAQQNSRYRRIQRFFKEVRFDYDALASLLMGLFDFDKGDYSLTLDRTNWKWGKKDINILMLGVVYKGIAIPIYWLVLNKQGNSNQKERIALLNRFIREFNKTRLSSVLGDREFIGQHWLNWFHHHDIPYLFRIRNNMLVSSTQGKELPVKRLFGDLAEGQTRVLRKPRCLGKQWVYLSALRLDSDELLIVASNKKLKNPIDIYARRWEIETLFQALKGRGFHWEESRLTQRVKVKKMVALLALAFCWAHKTGEWRHEQTPLKTKTHGRLEKTLFRYGLDYLSDQLIQGVQSSIKKQYQLIWLLVAPPNQIKEGWEF